MGDGEEYKVVGNFIDPSVQAILEFMYLGSVNIDQEELPAFLAVTEELGVHGLSGAPPGVYKIPYLPSLGRMEEIQLIFESKRGRLGDKKESKTKARKAWQT